MSNKHVITIFVLAVALLFGAFWAGLKVTRQDAAASGTNAATVGQAAAAEREPAPVPVQPAAAPLITDKPSADGRYIVVVSQFGTNEAANQLMNQLRHNQQYRSAYTQPPTAQNPFYRVSIGPYTDRQQAEQVMNDLSGQGLKGVMVEPWSQK